MPDGDAHDVDLPEPADGDGLEDAGSAGADDDSPDADDRERDDAGGPGWRDDDDPPGESPLAVLVAGTDGSGFAARGSESADAAPATWADEAGWADDAGDGPAMLDAGPGPGAAGDSGEWGGEGGWDSLDGPGAISADTGTAAAFEALVAGADDEAIEDLLADASPPEPTGQAHPDPGGPLPFAVAFGAVGGAWAAAPPVSGVGFGTAPARGATAATGQPASRGPSPVVSVIPLDPDGFAATCGGDHGGSPWWGPRRDRVEDAQEDARGHAIAWPGHGS